MPFEKNPFAKLHYLKSQMETKAVALAAAIKAQVASGNATLPSQEVQRIARECNQINSDFERELHRIEHAMGLSESQIRALEQEFDAHSLPAEADSHFWRADVEDFPTTGWMVGLMTLSEAPCCGSKASLIRNG